MTPRWCTGICRAIPILIPLWHSTQIKAGQNYAGWDNRAADEAIEKARALTDREQRRTFYSQFQQIFADEVPALLLYHPVYTYGVRSKVHDVQIGPLNAAGAIVFAISRNGTS